MNLALPVCKLTHMSETMADRIAQRLKEIRKSAHAASLEAGGSPSLIPNILNGRSENPRRDTLEKIANVLGVSVEWLAAGGETPEMPNDSEVAFAHGLEKRLPDSGVVPVLGTALGSLIPTNGEDAEFEGFIIDAEPIQRVRQPVGIAGQRSIYAIYVVGDSMYPMHPPGDIRFVQPHRPPAPGDTVVVQTKQWEHDPGQAYIKIYRRRAGGCVILEQINPAATLKIPEQYVDKMHRVVPNNELFGL